MLTKDLVNALGPQVNAKCGACGAPAEIEMHGYIEGDTSCNWCAGCALQMARKLLGDLCELLTKGGRHG